MRTSVIPISTAKAAAARYLSCLRPQEILVLQGSPLLGAAFAIRHPSAENVGSLAILIVANVCLVAHIFMLNDWSGLTTDLTDPNKTASVFTARGVGREEIGGLAASLLALLGSGVSNDVAWRVLLALGAVPAAAVIYLRCRMPESPRYQAQVQGRAEQAASQIPGLASGQVNGDGSGDRQHQMGLRAFLTNRRWLITLAGTAGCWFLLDYAYYGNTISTPQILGLISPHASTMTKIALQLAIFVVAAVPGYMLAIARLDRIGHRKLQLVGFAVMALCFAVIAIVPGMTTMVVPFLLVYGVSYFFTEFGPNMTTFVLPSELFPVSMRTTGHGISAGIGKLGAFIGVFLFPVLQTSLGLRGTLLLTAGVSVLGFALTFVLPEPAGRSLEDIAVSTRGTAARSLPIADKAPVP